MVSSGSWKLAWRKENPKNRKMAFRFINLLHGSLLEIRQIGITSIIQQRERNQLKEGSLHSCPIMDGDNPFADPSVTAAGGAGGSSS